MGQHAEDIINGDVDQFTGEWIGGGQGFPRTSHGRDHEPSVFAKGTKAIRKELAILIKSRLQGVTDEKEKNRTVEKCRQETNAKYGKGWREQYKYF